MSNRLDDPKKHDNDSNDANDISSIMKDAIAAAVQAGVSAGISEGMKQIREERNNDNQSGPYYSATADYDDEWNRERTPQDVGYDSVFPLLSSPDDIDDNEAIDDLVRASMLQLHQLPDSNMIVDNPLLHTGTIPDFARQEYGDDDNNTEENVRLTDDQSQMPDTIETNGESDDASLIMTDGDQEDILSSPVIQQETNNLNEESRSDAEINDKVLSEALYDNHNVDHSDDNKTVINDSAMTVMSETSTRADASIQEQNKENDASTENEHSNEKQTDNKLENIVSVSEHDDPIIALYESGAFWQPDPNKTHRKKRTKKTKKDANKAISDATLQESNKESTQSSESNNVSDEFMSEDNSIAGLISEEEFASLLGSVDENNTNPGISVPDEAELKSISELFDIAFEMNDIDVSPSDEAVEEKSDSTTNDNNNEHLGTANQRISNALLISQEMSRFLNETYNIPESEMDALYKSYGELFGDDETGYKTPSFIPKKEKKILHHEEPVPAMLDAYGKPLKSPDEATTLEELGISKENLPKTGLLLIPESNGIRTLKAPIEAVALDIPGESSASMLIECRDASIIEWDLGAILTESDLDIVAFWLNGASEATGSKCRISWSEKNGLVALTMSDGSTGILSASRGDDLFEDFATITTKKQKNGVEESVSAPTSVEAISNLPELDVDNATIAYKFAGVVFMLHFFSNNSDIEVSWKHPKNASNGLVTGFFANLAESIAEYGCRGSVNERKTVKHKTQASWFADHAAAYDYMFIGREDEPLSRRLKQIGIDSNGELLARVVEPKKARR